MIAMAISTRHGQAHDYRFVAQNSADNQPAKVSERKPPPSRAGKGPTPGSFKPGTSGNPGGRPRKALAAVDAVREKVDPNEWVDAELAIARDTDKPWDVRKDAWRALIDRGFVRSPQQIESRISQDNASQRDWSKLTAEEHRALVATLEAVPLLDTELTRDASTNETASDDAPIADAATVPPTIAEVKS